MCQKTCYRTVLLCLCSFLSTLLCLNAHAQNNPKETIKIGLSGPFSGGSAPMGESMRYGVHVAVEEINQFAGGVLGKKIELVERDDEANPKKGTAIADELINKEFQCRILLSSPEKMVKAS